MHARIYDFTLTSGGMQSLPVVGDFFKVISATGSINVIADTGASLDLMPGQGLREFSFNTLTIADKSGAANTGTILVGFSGMIDDRITGEVSIIDGGRALTLANAAFMKSSQVTGVAGNYSGAQLWNPVGSGVEVELFIVRVSSGTAATFGAGFGTVEMTGGSVGGRSKLSGGALSKSKIQWEVKAAAFGPQDVFVEDRAAGVPIIYEMKQPILVREGWGFLVWNATVGGSLSVNFEYTEK